MDRLLAALVLALLLSAQSSSVLAGDFEAFMKEWEEKREMASKYLLEAEKALKDGNKANSCLNQRKASKYGIEATNSLIKAMNRNGSSDGLENFEAGLRKWKELGDFC